MVGSLRFRILAEALVIGQFQTANLLGIGIQCGVFFGRKILVESDIGLVAIQQVADFTAGKLVGGFGSRAVQIIGFTVSEVIAVCNRFLISASYPANFACARNGSDAVAVCNCIIITASYPANIGVALYRAGIITVLDSSDIFSADTGNILVTAEIGIFQTDIPDFAALSHTENTDV